MRYLLIILSLNIISLGDITGDENFFNSISAFYLSGFAYHLLVVCIVGLFIYIVTGQYRNLTRYIGSKSFYEICIRNTLL